MSSSTENLSFPGAVVAAASGAAPPAVPAGRILFVDDEPNVLSALRRMLRPMRSAWEMEFVNSGQQALDRMAEKPFAVIVTDMRMPDLDGAALLKEVVARHPETVRIILSGQSDQEGILKSVSCAHQFLPKPCGPTTLLGRISRVLALRDQFANPAVVRLAAGIQALPSAATAYQALLREIQSSCASINRVGEIISQDIALSAKLLQLRISSFFGSWHAVSSPAQAAAQMGLDTVKSLVLSAGVVAECTGPDGLTSALNRLTLRSLLVGARAKAIAAAEHCPQQQIDEAFVAGILHDVGQLVLVAALPERYTQFLQTPVARTLDIAAAEGELFGATVPEIGAYLLGLWGLPQAIVEALAFQRRPDQDPAGGFTVLTALHVADALTDELARPCGGDDTSRRSRQSPLDLGYLERLGLAGRLPAWREACRINSSAGANP